MLFFFNSCITVNSGGGGQGGLNLPLPVPFNPGSRPVFFGSRPFAFFRLRNIAQCCVIFFLFLPLPATLRILLPAPSSPASRTPPAPFSPGLPPPCPPPLNSKFQILTIPRRYLPANISSPFQNHHARFLCIVSILNVLFHIYWKFSSCVQKFNANTKLHDCITTSQ